MGDDRRTVLLCGATGLVGGECLRLLLADGGVGRLHVLLRRALSAEAGRDPRLTQQVVDFDRLGEQAELAGVHQIVCALGTTMKQAGSREAFRRVDHDYPLELARLGVERGARHYLLVTAVGADPRSRIFYNRVKGELERALLALPDRSGSILRPSLLVGERATPRRAEALAARLGFLFPSRYKPIAAADVAAGIVRLAREDAPGQRIVESAELRAWTGGAQ
jgi:uncharacterized protein YbjT (DUF2867 family)